MILNKILSDWVAQGTYNYRNRVETHKGRNQWTFLDETQNLTLLRLVGTIAGVWGNRLVYLLVLSRFVETSHERPEKSITIGYHERSKSRTSTFTTIVTQL